MADPPRQSTTGARLARAGRVEPEHGRRAANDARQPGDRAAEALRNRRIDDTNAALGKLAVGSADTLKGTSIMARKRRRSRSGGKGGGGGGALSSLRGGFRSVAHGVSGTGKPRQASSRTRPIQNVVIAALLIGVAIVLLRRFGFWR